MSPENKDGVHSHHIFLFAFSWSIADLGNGKLKGRKERLLFWNNQLEGSEWERKSFININDYSLYNEYVYFYPFAQ
ncbi:MAG: hypothetical protein AAF632_26045, partial [Bacteroidota bacterium]